MSEPLITIEHARELVLAATRPLDSERISIDEALNRIAAEDVRAADDVPPFPCSAMDGYAIRAGAAGRSLAVIGESRAGAPFEVEVGDGEAVRISTGAAVPGGATAVIPQEDVGGGGTRIDALAEIGEGVNVRSRGEDMRSGTTVLTRGTVLGAVELGAAVAAGNASVAVARAPKVATFCTGDELRAPRGGSRSG